MIKKLFYSYMNFKKPVSGTLIFFAQLVCLLICSLKVYGFSYVDDSWVEVKSNNFIIVTDHDDKTAREMIGELERFRHYVQLFIPLEIPKESPPIRIFGFKKRMDFNNFVGTDEFSGFYFSSENGGYAIADLSTYKESDAQDRGFGNEALLHEYVHYLSNLGGLYTAKPKWLSEGMAEYLSTMITTESEIKYGRLSEHSYLSYYYSKYGKRYVPVEKMLKRNDWFKQDDESVSFYASAVVFIHYSLADAARKKQFDKFVGMLSEGADVDKAWSTSYDVNYAEMGKRLKKYLNKRTFNFNLITLKKPYDYGEVRLAKLEKTDTQVRLADFLLHLSRPGYLDKIEVLGITKGFSYDTHEAKVLQIKILIRKGEFEKAEKVINEQIANKPESKSEWLQLLGSVYFKKGAKLDLSIADRVNYFTQARGKYRASIHANNLNFKAFLGLGNVYRFWGMIDPKLDVKEGIVAYDEALYFMEWDHAQSNLADMLYLTGETKKANALYKKLVVTSHVENTISSAKEVLNGSKAVLFRREAKGCIHYGMYDLADAYFKKAIAESGASAIEYNEYAWWLITGKGKAYRNKVLALKYSQKAVEMSESKNPSYLDTLAAAYAAHEDFKKAVVMQKKAIELSKENSEAFNSALNAYEKREQYYVKD